MNVVKIDESMLCIDIISSILSLSISPFLTLNPYVARIFRKFFYRIRNSNSITYTHVDEHFTKIEPALCRHIPHRFWIGCANKSNASPELRSAKCCLLLSFELICTYVWRMKQEKLKGREREGERERE